MGLSAGPSTGLRASMAVRLPTEAEWEYACRAGTTTPFSTGLTIGTDEANYEYFADSEGGKGVDRKKTIPAGSLKPNAFGLYDMHGNVWEWCRDIYGPYPTTDVVDPRGPADGRYHVMRGGYWGLPSQFCRSANRYWNGPDYGDGYYALIGFRVVVSVGHAE